MEKSIEEFEEIQEDNLLDDEPMIGMSFDSEIEMYNYYREYGKRKGFPVMRRSSSKGIDGMIRHVSYVCGRSGATRSKSSNPLRPQPNAKIGCNAKLGGGLEEDGKWRIRVLNIEHNHTLLTPTKSKFFRCNRSLSSYAKKKLNVNDRAGIRLSQNYQSLVIEAGGHENVTFTERDCRNHIQKERLLRLGDGDAAALQNYFMRVQSEDNRFFFSMQVDDEGRLKNVFWAEPRNREAYKEFGDVVTFDTTYLTNKYDMPFAPFVGVNHHGHSILFGCGLISHEDVETFTWLFRTWLACMSNSAPIGIITDQDKAMKIAIAAVFPNTRHRWCLWHILKKIPDKLGGYKQYRDISDMLHCAVYDSQSPAKFEEIWHRMIVEYDLGGNDWLHGLYNERHHWVPCYLKDSFWAGMSTTQRSESMNAFFDGYVNSKTALKQFVEQYSNALKSKVQKEVEEDARCLSQQMPCVTSYEMEKQVRDVYTILKFQEFQKELTAKIHAIYIMIRNDSEVLPEKYILRRWRKDVWRCHSRVKTSHELHGCTDEQKRYEKMCVRFAEVANVAARNVESSNLVLNWIEDVRRDLPEPIQCEGNNAGFSGQGSCSNSMGISTNAIEEVRDPEVRRRKGRPPCQRKKSTRSTKPKKNSTRSDAEDGHVDNILSSQVSVVTPQGSNIATTLLNVGGSDIHTNVYPYGTTNYYNHPQLQQHPQLVQHGHFQQLLFQQANEYGVNSEFQHDFGK
ncbi:protein FAR1-RELATED SEQUENCE 5-like [Citrus sinensis]|uniref:protein FAR1-RELATED SEQUENCE 5-like n=1 Tax=Citrus sinensis TaxID=2711 RepID=UPI002279A3AB|nr:protein FAR1-RELATED SEQUENCE 5-like [Citrus sinensis]